MSTTSQQQPETWQHQKQADQELNCASWEHLLYYLREWAKSLVHMPAPCHLDLNRQQITAWRSTATCKLGIELVVTQPSAQNFTGNCYIAIIDGRTGPADQASTAGKWTGMQHLQHQNRRQDILATHLITNTATPSKPSLSIAPKIGLPAVPLGSPSSLLRVLPASLNAQQLCEAEGSEASWMFAKAWTRQRCMSDERLYADRQCQYLCVSVCHFHLC